MIIAFCGYGYSGKDTAADVLCEEFGFSRIAFADALRDMAEALNPIMTDGGLRYRDTVTEFGYEAAKKIPEVRRFLQVLGGEAVRGVIGDNTWVDIVTKKITEGDWVVTDCRYRNEMQAIHALGGVVIQISRPGYGPVNDHVSETLLEGAAPDLVIVNDGTIDDLHAKIRTICRSGSEDREGLRRASRLSLPEVAGTCHGSS